MFGALLILASLFGEDGGTKMFGAGVFQEINQKGTNPRKNTGIVCADLLVTNPSVGT